jgi:hypothetical protein
MKLTKARYTYEQRYQIAFPGQLPPQGSDKPITYSGSHGHEEGSLRPGESIQIRNDGWCSMSCPLTSLDEAAARLRQENYNVDVVSGLLYCQRPPYVTTEKVIERGVLAFPVEFSDGDLRASRSYCVLPRFAAL